MFVLEIITPERVVVKEEVSSFIAPGVMGEFGVLAGHTPFLAMLKTGEARHYKNGEVEYLALGKGFAEVMEKRVSCLVETAEKREEIDLERARSAKKRAEERIKKSDDPTIDCEKAKAALNRALVRIKTAGEI